MTFGILTLATPNDFKKAIGLALSARVSNPGIPLAVACSPKLKEVVSPYFDYVVEEDKSLRGFEHKIHLDRYSPFEDTFFFDSDVLLFKDLKPVAERWANQSYTACGEYVTEGFSSFGMNYKSVRERFQKERTSIIDGAGHSYFRKPACFEIFDFAREVSDNHREYVGDIPYADEDILDIAMTKFDLVPAPRHDGNLDFFSRYLSAVPGTMVMDATLGVCHFTARHSGKRMEPYMMHFAANEAPFPYARQLDMLYKKFNIKQSGLYREALKDFYTINCLWPLKRQLKRMLGKGV